MDANAMNRIHSAYYKMLNDWDEVCQKYHIPYFVAYGSMIGAVRHNGIIPWDGDVDLWMTRDAFEKIYRQGGELLNKYEWIMPEDYGRNKYFDCVPRLSSNYYSIRLDQDLLDYYDSKINKMHIDIFFLDKTRADISGKLQRIELGILYGFMNAYRHKSLTEEYPFYLKVIRTCMNLIGHCISLKWLIKKASKVSKKYANDPDAQYMFCSNGEYHTLFELYPIEDFKNTVYIDFDKIKVPVPAGFDRILRTRFGDYMQLPPAEKQTPNWARKLLQTEDFVFEDQ